MKIAALIVGLLVTGCGVSDPVEWEHGYKTEYVVATRYKNPHLGYNIGFTLPKNPNDADRADMVEWLESRGVHPYEMGGSPGAPIYAIVDGVTDKESANRFLAKFLPDFDLWARSNLK